MNTLNNTNRHQTPSQKGVMGLLKKLNEGIKELFTLEEVEVTYTKVGNTTKYSYTKIHHKHTL